jgi:hypothetical protein
VFDKRREEIRERERDWDDLKKKSEKRFSFIDERFGSSSPMLF